MIFFCYSWNYTVPFREDDKTIIRQDHKTMTMNNCDKWWTGDTFEEEWNATSKACGARAMVVRNYYPSAFERMSQYQKGRLTSVELPKTKSSNPKAEPMFCDSTILGREDHCTGFTYCVVHMHHTGQRFWFCDDCSKCYHERLSQGKNIHFDEDEKEEWIQVVAKI